MFNASFSFRTTSAICRISSELDEKCAIKDGNLTFIEVSFSLFSKTRNYF